MHAGIMSNTKDPHERFASQERLDRLEKTVAEARVQFNAVLNEMPQGHGQLANLEAALNHSEQTTRNIRARLQSFYSSRSRKLNSSRDVSLSELAEYPASHFDKSSASRRLSSFNGMDYVYDEWSPSDTAKRALQVLASCTAPRTSHHCRSMRQSISTSHSQDIPTDVDVDVDVDVDSVHPRVADGSSHQLPEKFVSEQCVRAAMAACPLPADIKTDVKTTCNKNNTSATIEIHVECTNSWRAGLWLCKREFAAEYEEVENATAHRASAFVPCVARFVAANESLSQFVASDHAVFQALSERASAAANFFWQNEFSHSDALSDFLLWLLLHRDAFKKPNPSDGRVLAFDTSRGIFMPAIIYSYAWIVSPAGRAAARKWYKDGSVLADDVPDAPSWPVHPRSCIPLKEDKPTSGSHTSSVALAGGSAKKIGTTIPAGAADAGDLPGTF